MTDRYEEIRRALSHEVWAAAQLAPSEGIADGVSRVEVLLRKAAHPAITHCEGCGCDWLDNGLNPVGCPYCKQSADAKILVAERDALEAENARLRETLRRILDNEAPDWKFAEEFGGYVLDDELREEARAALKQDKGSGYWPEMPKNGGPDWTGFDG